jgi:hypothetical protein
MSMMKLYADVSPKDAILADGCYGDDIPFVVDLDKLPEWRRDALKELVQSRGDKAYVGSLRSASLEGLVERLDDIIKQREEDKRFKVEEERKKREKNERLAVEAKEYIVTPVDRRADMKPPDLGWGFPDEDLRGMVKGAEMEARAFSMSDEELIKDYDCLSSIRVINIECLKKTIPGSPQIQRYEQAIAEVERRGAEKKAKAEALKAERARTLRNAVERYMPDLLEEWDAGNLAQRSVIHAIEDDLEERIGDRNVPDYDDTDVDEIKAFPAQELRKWKEDKKKIDQAFEQVADLLGAEDRHVSTTLEKIKLLQNVDDDNFHDADSDGEIVLGRIYGATIIHDIGGVHFQVNWWGGDVED